MARKTAVKEKEAMALTVPDTDEIKRGLALVDPTAIPAERRADPELLLRAEKIVTALVNIERKNLSHQQAAKNSVEQTGSSIQRQAAHQSAMLREPIKKLSQRGEDGGEIAGSLVDLKVEVEGLDPAKFDFEPGWFSRMVGLIPGVGKPVKRYFSKFESAQTVIDAIIHSLEEGQKQLQRDNITLRDDQSAMKETTLKLERTIVLAQLIDNKLQQGLETIDDEFKRKFIQEELLFPLRQRIMDIQQQLVVNQQGVLATEIVIRNNLELIRGVKRALNVTVTALQVAVTVALALADQKIVLNKITALNKTTDSLIGGTAQRLKTQGTAIQKMAASTQLSMETLKAAFADLNSAIEDISNFRQQALPQMANTILEMEAMTREAEESIKKMTEGDLAKPAIVIEDME